MNELNYECESCGARYGLIIYAGDSVIDDGDNLKSDIIYCPFCTTETYVEAASEENWGEDFNAYVEEDEEGFDIDEILSNREDV